jgi:hypothetical protein
MQQVKIRHGLLSPVEFRWGSGDIPRQVTSLEKSK